jgi:site-specific DNA-methyltransferase (adenine-specific)
MLTITNEDNMALMARYPDKYFNIAIIDPPYGGAGQDVDRTGGSWAAKYGKKIKKWDIAPDKSFFNELFRVSNFQIICGGNYFDLPPNRNFIIWEKHIPEEFTLAMCEFFWTNIKGNAKIIKMPSMSKGRIHPTEKPVELYAWLLSRYCKPGWKILDTHLGSGSIAIACHNAGFDLTACEIDKEYFDKAMERINKHITQQDLFEKKEMYVSKYLFEMGGGVIKCYVLKIAGFA